MIVSLTPVPAELKKGMTIEVQAAAAPSGATVLNLNSLGNKPVVKSGGAPLVGLEFLAGDILRMSYDGANWQLPPTQSVGRLTANKTIYVNGAIGSDANDGLSNVAGHALATLQGAINLAWGYAPSQFVITIIAETGTCAGATTPSYAGPTVVIDGLSAASVTISAGSNYGFLVLGPNSATIRNVTATNTAPTAGAALFSAQNGATLNTANTISGSGGGAVFGAFAGGTVNTGSHTFSGGCYGFFWASGLGIINSPSTTTFTVSAPLTVAHATCIASGAGIVQIGTPIAFVNPGNVTGSKYDASFNGVINTGSAGTSYFPGTVAGSTSNGGQYA